VFADLDLMHPGPVTCDSEASYSKMHNVWKESKKSLELQSCAALQPCVDKCFLGSQRTELFCSLGVAGRMSVSSVLNEPNSGSEYLCKQLSI